jgi:glycosyltransferase involved in cell wall biosynthesis/2-polyprenyl-3-methyl-5-hydroxy-6-metoxy-1,4-benzoquinol methylase
MKTDELKRPLVHQAPSVLEKNPSDVYDKSFFESYMRIGPEDYARIADVINEQFAFYSALDIGCGPALILHKLATFGYETLGVEASIHAIEKAPIEMRPRILQADITTWNPPEHSHDLVICSEVAEHLDARHADKLVETITTAAKDTVFFTAATPGQGGHDHVNEQPHTYWIEKFQDHGFRYDHAKTEAVRLALRNAVKTLHWFPANAIVFKRLERAVDPTRANGAAAPGSATPQDKTDPRARILANAIHETFTFDDFIITSLGKGPVMIASELGKLGYVERAQDADLAICLDTSFSPQENAADLADLADSLTKCAKDVIFLSRPFQLLGPSFLIDHLATRGFHYMHGKSLWLRDRIKFLLERYPNKGIPGDPFFQLPHRLLEPHELLTNPSQLHCRLIGHKAMIFERRIPALVNGPDARPSVSVVIPCFKQEHFLRDALKSVVDQEPWTNTNPSKTDLEIIVVTPDVHPDSMVTLLAKHYGAEIVKDPGHGLAHARNLGIQAASGSLIVPLDADDKLEPAYLRKTVALTKGAGPHVIVVPDLQNFGTDERGVFRPDVDQIARGYTTECCLFSKALWQAVKDRNGEGYDSASPVEDWAFWLDCHEHQPTLRRLPEILFRYRQHESQLTKTDPRPAFLAATRALRPHLFPQTPEDQALVRSEPLQEWAHKRLEMSSSFGKQTSDRLLTILGRTPSNASTIASRPAETAAPPVQEPAGAVGANTPTDLPNGIDPTVHARFQGIIKDALAQIHARDAEPIPARSPHDGSKVCLCMIVKDETRVIERCLRSMAKSFDCWCIVDTGSTDGTQHLVKHLLSNVPGELHELPWRGFSASRNDSIELAEKVAQEHGATHLLINDADDVMEGTVPKDLDKDVYEIAVHHGIMDHARPQLFRIGKNFRFKGGRVHEYLSTTGASSYVRAEGVAIRITGGGSRSADGVKKYLSDAAVLEEEMLENPVDGRPVFYCAQSYRDAGVTLADRTPDKKNPECDVLYDKALALYEKRAAMGGVPHEVFESLMKIAWIHTVQDRDVDTIIKAYLRAFENRPSRAEPLYYLGRYLRMKHSRHALASLMQASASLMKKPSDFLVEPEIYSWRAKDELSVCLYWIGRHEDNVRLSASMLKDPSVPQSEHPRIQSNINFSLNALGKLPGK